MQEVSGSIPLGSTIFARTSPFHSSPPLLAKNGGAKRLSAARDSVLSRAKGAGDKRTPAFTTP
jgi:hypothetical protein